MKKAKRVKINVPAGIAPEDLESHGRKLYAMATGRKWDCDSHDLLVVYFASYSRDPYPQCGFMELFNMVRITGENLVSMSSGLFNIPMDTARRLLRSSVLSSGDDADEIDYEMFIRKCASYKGRRKVVHGTRYRVYRHPFIRNFLSSEIETCHERLVRNDKEAGAVLCHGYRMETSSGDRLEIELAERINSLPGLTGREYIMLMGFWSVFMDNNGRIPLSALWETMCGSRWSHQKQAVKECFFAECESFIKKINGMAKMCRSVKVNGRLIDPGLLFGTVSEAGGFFDRKVEGNGASIGRIVRCHDCDQVEFSMTRPELLFKSGKSVLPIPEELLSTMDRTRMNIYLSYRVLWKIKMGDKASAPVILSSTIAGLFGEEWSRKSAKHHMEKMKQAGYIKGYKMTRRGIEFEVADKKINTEKKENEDEN